MAAVAELVGTLSSLLWSEYCLIPLLAGVGLYLSFGLRLFPWTQLLRGFRLLWRGRRADPALAGGFSGAAGSCTHARIGCPKASTTSGMPFTISPRSLYQSVSSIGANWPAMGRRSERFRLR